MTLKRTTEDVKKYFAKQGCILLSEYLGVRKPLEYICKCGKKTTTDYNHFSQGKRCGYCGKNGRTKKYTLNEVKEIFAKRGCELLEKTYKSNKTLMKYKCQCGRISKISFVGFVHQEQNCFYCGLEKNRKSNHHEWKTDRKQHREDQLFRKKCYKALSSTLKATNQIKVGHTSDMLGYGPKELQEYITQHHNWKDVKDQEWHLDHIFPITAFLEHGIRDIALINSLNNLQPMLGKDNLSKGDDYDKEKFNKWIRSLNYDF